MIDGPFLAIETSCDETAAASSTDGPSCASVIASQAALHTPYGGVVPEVAARHHLGTVNVVIDQALTDAGVGLYGMSGDRGHAAPGSDRRAACRASRPPRPSPTRPVAL